MRIAGETCEEEGAAGCFSSSASSRPRIRVCLRVRDATLPSSERPVVCLFVWLIAAGVGVASGLQQRRSGGPVRAKADCRRSSESRQRREWRPAEKRREGEELQMRRAAAEMTRDAREECDRESAWIEKDAASDAPAAFQSARFHTDTEGGDEDRARVLCLTSSVR